MNASRITFKHGCHWRIQEASKGPSSKGTPMLTFDVELFNNPTVTALDDETGEHASFDINGLTLRHWVTLAPQTLPFVNEWLSSHGMDRVKTIKEVEALDPGLFIGKVGAGIVEAKKKPQLDSNKQPVLNLHTNEPMFTVERRINQVMAKD